MLGAGVWEAEDALLLIFSWRLGRLSADPPLRYNQGLLAYDLVSFHAKSLDALSLDCRALCGCDLWCLDFFDRR